MMRIDRLAALAAFGVILLLPIKPGIAGPVRFETKPPSDESAISVSVDQARLQGLLSKADLERFQDKWIPVIRFGNALVP